MSRAFNNGIGMVVIVGGDAAQSVRSCLEKKGETVYTIGVLVEREEGKEGCVLKNLEAWKG